MAESGTNSVQTHELLGVADMTQRAEEAEVRARLMRAEAEVIRAEHELQKAKRLRVCLPPPSSDASRNVFKMI
eukprot:1914267-Pyramimonas_sp.AAC.1